MPERWRALGLISLFLGLIVYIDQIFRIEYPWHWRDLWHHEVVIAIACSIGITLLVVAVIEDRNIKYRKRIAKSIRKRPKQ